MLKSASGVTAALVGVLLLALATGTTAMAATTDRAGRKCNLNGCPTPPSSPPTTVTPGASEGQIEIAVSVEGQTSVGDPYVRSWVRRVPPGCWMVRWWTGRQYYEYRTSPEFEQTQAMMPPQYRAQAWPGWDAHADDDTGYWYTPKCADAAPSDYMTAYLLSHPPLYVSAGEPTPSEAVDVAPEVLAQAAYEALQLPEGTVAWNPRLTDLGGATLVGTDTWVWVEDVPVTARVTASVASGTSATVEAHLDHVTVSAPGADDTICTRPGQPWTAGAGEAPCSIRFNHSSIGGQVAAHGDLPTVTMTVTTTWAASWTSSLDPTPRDLPAQDTEVTAEIAVAESQSLVTRR